MYHWLQRNLRPPVFERATESFVRFESFIFSSLGVKISYIHSIVHSLFFHDGIWDVVLHCGDITRGSCMFTSRVVRTEWSLYHQWNKPHENTSSETIREGNYSHLPCIDSLQSLVEHMETIPFDFVNEKRPMSDSQDIFEDFQWIRWIISFLKMIEKRGALFDYHGLVFSNDVESNSTSISRNWWWSHQKEQKNETRGEGKTTVQRKRTNEWSIVWTRIRLAETHEDKIHTLLYLACECSLS